MKDENPNWQKMSFIKKNFICKEKSGAKIKKHNQLYFGMVVVEITHKIKTFFKALASKKATAWCLKNLGLAKHFYEK